MQHSGMRALAVACMLGYADIVRLLLDQKGCFVDAQVWAVMEQGGVGHGIKHEGRKVCEVAGKLKGKTGGRRGRRGRPGWGRAKRVEVLGF